MNRIFLAFMALLAGFAAQVAPAAARVSEDTQIGAAADARLLQRQTVVFSSKAATRPVQGVLPEPKLVAQASETGRLAPLGVLIGIDRARE